MDAQKSAGTSFLEFPRPLMVIPRSVEFPQPLVSLLYYICIYSNRARISRQGREIRERLISVACLLPSPAISRHIQSDAKYIRFRTMRARDCGSAGRLPGSLTRADDPPTRRLRHNRVLPRNVTSLTSLTRNMCPESISFSFEYLVKHKNLKDTYFFICADFDV